MASGRELRVLIVEDVISDAELCQHELKRGGVRFSARRVDTRDALELAVDEFAPDLVISDFSMPTNFDGLTALELVRAKMPEVPFVFVSGTIGEERAVEAMKRGATDYVLKDRLSRLVPVVTRALKEAEDRSARHKAEQELEETRSRLDSIVTSLDDVVWSVSPEPYAILYVNRATETIWQRAPGDFYRNPDTWLEAVHPDDREKVESLWRQTLQQGTAFDLEYRIVRPDGGMRWIHDRGSPVRDDNGRVIRIDGLARDITQGKIQQERIARLSRIQAVLSGINAAIVRIRNRQELFERACRIAVEHGGFRLAWIGLIEPQMREVRPVAWMGEDGSFLREIHPSIDPDPDQSRGITGMAIRSAKAVVVNDVENDERVGQPEVALRYGFRSFVALPLIVESKAIGAVMLYTGEAGFFDDDELKLLTELAGDISFALEHIAKSEQVDYLAFYDGLTGLPNRRLFGERLRHFINMGESQRSRAAVILTDIERMRSVNESLGMAAGDELLRQVARRIESGVNEEGVVARLTGNCFGIMFRSAANAEQIAHFIEKCVMKGLKEPILVAGQELRVSLRAGIATYPPDGTNPEVLCTNAETALRAAKVQGERFLFYSPQMNASVAERLVTENRLRVAVAEEQFVLYYQPKVELATGRIVGLEALLRWITPEGTTVSPGEFISILEETSMILDVGRWALHKAISDHAAWRERGLKPPSIAVNVSAIQLRNQQFVADVKAAVEGGGESGRQIELEITESMIMEDIEGSIRKLAEIRALGVGLSLDDFGTGYSSLSYIARLPFSALKIDRSFIAAMAESSEHMAIVSAVISLGRALSLKVIAEGVETEEQANLLRLLRCDEAQGYLYGRPQPENAITPLFDPGHTKTV